MKGFGLVRLVGKSGLIQEEFGISYLLIFVDLVAVETTRNHGCVVVIGLSGWKENGELLAIVLVLRNYLG